MIVKFPFLWLMTSECNFFFFFLRDNTETLFFFKFSWKPATCMKVVVDEIGILIFVGEKRVSEISPFWYSTTKNWKNYCGKQWKATLLHLLRSKWEAFFLMYSPIQDVHKLTVDHVQISQLDYTIEKLYWNEMKIETAWNENWYWKMPWKMMFVRQNEEFRRCISSAPGAPSIDDSCYAERLLGVGSIFMVVFRAQINAS